MSEMNIEAGIEHFNFKSFILFKALNSSFTGLSVGIFFTLYAPLKPIVYSIGGVLLALGIMLLARFYAKIMNFESFFRFSLFVELLMLVLIFVVLIGKFSLFTAMAVYSGYQLSFVFGGYLLRVESLVISEPKSLESIDIVKQIGYIAGLVLSYLFYQFTGGYSSQEQVWLLHYGMLFLELAVIILLLKGFKKL